MNGETGSTASIVRCLGAIVLRQSHDDLERVFKRKIHEPAQFKRCYVAVAKEGDVETGRIGGIISSWWEVTPNNVLQIDQPDLPRTSVAELDESPVLKIFLKDDRFVLGERYGSALVCRRVGALETLYSCASLDDIEVLWRSKE